MGTNRDHRYQPQSYLQQNIFLFKSKWKETDPHKPIMSSMNTMSLSILAALCVVGVSLCEARGPIRSQSSAALQAADWCMFCGNCCNGLSAEREIEAQKQRLADIETEAAVAKWCMFCGNCCNDKKKEEQKAMMAAASTGGADAVSAAKWCMFCGNCCNGVQAQVANWCMFCGNCCNGLTVEQAEVKMRRSMLSSRARKSQRI